VRALPDRDCQRQPRFPGQLHAKTAKTLGLKLPDKVLALADEVIE
jgi:hypothetical protein